MAAVSVADVPLGGGGGDYTIQEEKEIRLIENGLRLDIEKKRWTVSYPKIKSYDGLPNNCEAAKMRLFNTEKR